ncbi:hypothetical protein VTK56DRAFT_6136 [Thermocarpiscus australiensis]
MAEPVSTQEIFDGEEHFDRDNVFVDITHLDNPRYCFVVPPCDYDEFEDYAPPPHNQPRSGRQYDLDKHPLVDIAVRADLWPRDSLVSGPSVLTPTPGRSHPPGTSRGPASLWDQALAVFMRTMLWSHSPDPSLLDAPMQIPRFKSSLKNYLMSVKGRLPNTPAVLGLLRAAYAGETFLDWAHFEGLRPKTIIAAAFHGPELKDVCGLSLCPD